MRDASMSRGLTFFIRPRTGRGSRMQMLWVAALARDQISHTALCVRARCVSVCDRVHMRVRVRLTVRACMCLHGRIYGACAG
jgi:hypothetical protein